MSTLNFYFRLSACYVPISTFSIKQPYTNVTVYAKGGQCNTGVVTLNKQRPGHAATGTKGIKILQETQMPSQLNHL